MIDANRVIRLYLKGVADSQSIKVKSAALVTGVIYCCQEQTNNVARQREGGGERGGKVPPFVLISPDVTCEAHFGNYPWKISMSRSIVIKWFEGRGLPWFKWYPSSHAQRGNERIVLQMSSALQSYFTLSLCLTARVWVSDDIWETDQCWK